jgi:hypothetical protein
MFWCKNVETDCALAFENILDIISLTQITGREDKTTEINGFTVPQLFFEPILLYLTSQG